ncbi:D-2-hydroxyacid dehydrogenase [Clostridium sp. 1001271B_151109_B4]|uniref:D-2-hydroxyacid dehydrogenase n=1 Tax=Clostridium sp. 1001271B_151109_B4 TaxID=2787148 RepID=UPI0018AB0AE5|nr:D-2-hydroxyacid dehydrogenase [Clostridium sp. 1001271B_151109_B4]
MIRILTNDGLQQGAVDKLVSMGFEVVNTHYDKDVLGETLKQFDVLVIRSATKVTADILDAEDGGKLKLIIRAGVGIDNIDVNYAKEKGIVVKNTPNASSDSVAELVIGHMFAIARFLGVSNYTMRNGQWNKKKYEGIELSGKTLGIIGMGRIGRALANKATALGMNVVYNDLFGKQDNLSYDFLEFNELLNKSDFISLHVPYDKNKGSVIGAKEIEEMKDGVYLINCARGKVVDEKALLDALNTGKIAGAGIDVFEEEPTKNDELVNHPNVSVTPHIGAATKEAQNRIGEEVVTTIVNYFDGEVSPITAKSIESI